MPRESGPREVYIDPVRDEPGGAFRICYADTGKSTGSGLFKGEAYAKAYIKTSRPYWRIVARPAEEAA